MKNTKRRKFIKTWILMLLSILLIVTLIGFFSGSFNTNCTKTDIISLTPRHIASEGEHWALCSREKKNPIYGSVLFQATPYLIYQGSSKYSPGKKVDVRGLYTYHKQINNGKETSFNLSFMDDQLVMNRHFVIGEKRWFYRTDLTDEVIDKAFVKVTWKEAGKSRHEYLASENLTQQEKKECREWIDSGGNTLDEHKTYLKVEQEK